MLNFLRRWLDELITGSFLLLVLILVVLFPVEFATAGGRLFAQSVLWSVVILVALLLIAARYTRRVRPMLRVAAEIGPMVVAVLGYSSLKLLHAAVITHWLGIASKDPWMMAADGSLFGKTPYLWFAQWGLDSRLFLEVMSIFYGLYPWTPVIVLSWFMYKGDMRQLRLGAAERADLALLRLSLLHLHSGVRPALAGDAIEAALGAVFAYLLVSDGELPLPNRLLSEPAYGQSMADGMDLPEQGSGLDAGSRGSCLRTDYHVDDCAAFPLRCRCSGRAGVDLPDLGAGAGNASSRNGGLKNKLQKIIEHPGSAHRLSVCTGSTLALQPACLLRRQPKGVRTI
jgi:hypothetical protein